MASTQLFPRSAGKLCANSGDRKRAFPHLRQLGRILDHFLVQTMEAKRAQTCKDIANQEIQFNVTSSRHLALQPTSFDAFPHGHRTKSGHSTDSAAGSCNVSPSAAESPIMQEVTPHAAALPLVSDPSCQAGTEG